MANLRIGPRIYLIVAILAVASLVAAAIAAGGMSHIRATYNSAVTERAPVTKTIDDLRQAIPDMKLQIVILLVPSFGKDWLRSQTGDIAQLKKNFQGFIAYWDSAAVKGATPAERAKFDELRPAMRDWMAAIDGYMADIDAYLAGDQQAYRRAFASNDSGAVDQTHKKVDALLVQLVKINDAENAKVYAEARRDQNAAMFRLLAAEIGALLLGLIVAVLIAGSITRPLKDALGFAESVSKGDLGAKMPDHPGGEVGELTRAVEAMKESLVLQLHNMRSFAVTVSASVEKVVKAAEDVSAAAARSGRGELVTAADRLAEEAEELERAVSTLKGGGDAAA